MNEQFVSLITRLVQDALQQQTSHGNDVPIPVGISARHIHLCQKDVETLFGPGHQLTFKSELMGGQFAAVETCTIVGLKLRALEKVRVLGPARSKTQVEISATDARSLGISAPVRNSGDIIGSAPIAIVGPQGAIYLKEGCIVAARHIHMDPETAEAIGVRDQELVSVQADNQRRTIYDQVLVRVDPSFTLEMHIDTDEANAAGIKPGDHVQLIRSK